MKNLLALLVIAIGAVGCTLPRVDNSPISDGQIALLKKSQGYVLPAQSEPAPSSSPAGLVTEAVTAAYRVALGQGLIADASDAANGILVAGQRIDERQVIVLLRFYVSKDGRVGFEDSSNWKLIDASAGEKMSHRLISALVTGK